MIEYRRGSRFVEGGSSELFLGVAVGLGGFERRVILKAVRPELETDPAPRQRLADEARLLSKIHHPGVIKISDFVELEGRSHQVLEYLDGKDLRAWAKAAPDPSAPFQPQVVLHVIKQLALTLEYVHGARDEDGQALGILHRDVSPGNIILTHAGEVKLIDFGIARWRGQESYTRVGETVGTPGFMAPEQLSGGPMDARSDLFSLACVAHWMFTGSSPVAPPDAESRLLAGKPVALSAQVPERWRPLLARALEVNPARRPASAGAWAVMLSQLREPGEAPTEDEVRAWVTAAPSTAAARAAPTEGLWSVGWEVTGSQSEGAQAELRPPTAMVVAPEATSATIEAAAHSEVLSFVRPSTFTRPDETTQDTDGGAEDEEDTESKGIDLEDTTAGALASPARVDPTDLRPARAYAESPPMSPEDTPARISLTPPRIVEHTDPSPLRLVAMAVFVFAVAFGVSRLLWQATSSGAPSAPRPAPAPITVKEPPPPPDEPLVAVAPPSGPVLVPPAPAPVTEEAPSEEVPRPPPRKRPSRAGTEAPRAAAETPPPAPAWAPPIIVWSVERAVEDKGLPRSGLDWVDATRARAWKECLRKHDVPCLDRLGPELLAELERAQIDGPFLSRKLEELESTLREVSSELTERELEAIDRRLLDLKLLARQSPDRRQLRRALEEVRSTQARLQKKR